MKFLAPVFRLLLFAAAIGSFAGGGRAAAGPSNLTCDVGPITRSFGGSPWLVYSCDDGRSLVILSAPGNPAMPYYFMLSPTENGYRLRGEGTGNPEYTAPALNEIQTLTLEDIEGMIAQTRAK